MAIENVQEVIEYLRAEGNANFLQENGFTTTVEKVVEKPADYTAEGVTNFLQGNQGMRDKLYNENVTSFMKKKLGVETVTPDLLGKDIMLKDDMDNFKKAAIGAVISNHTEYVDLILDKIDYSKINFKNGKLEGVTETLTEFQGKYPNLFTSKEEKKPGTPPAAKTGVKEVTKEQFSKMTYTEKAALYTENKELYDQLSK